MRVANLNTLTFSLTLLTTLGAVAVTNGAHHNHTHHGDHGVNPFNPNDRVTLRHIRLQVVNETLPSPDAILGTTSGDVTGVTESGTIFDTDTDAGASGDAAAGSEVDATPDANSDSETGTGTSIVARQVQPPVDGDDDDDDGLMVIVPAACTDSCTPLMNSTCEDLDCECTAASASLLVECLDCSAATAGNLTEAQAAYDVFVADCLDEDRPVSNFTITPTVGPVTVPPLIPIDGTETDGGDGDLDEDGEDGVDGEDEDEDEEDEEEDGDGEDIPDDQDELDEITHDDDSDDGDSDAVKTTVVVNGTTIVGTVPAAATATTTQTVTQIVGAGAAGATGSIGGSELDGAGSGPQVQGQAFGETQDQTQDQPADAFPTGLGVQDPNSFTAKAKAKARRHRRHRKRGVPVFSPLAAGPGPGPIPSPPDANVQLVREVTDDTLSDSLSIERVGVVSVSNGAVGVRPGGEAVSAGGMLGMLTCVGVVVGVVGSAVGVY